MKAFEASRKWESKGLTLCGMILLSFVAGSVTTAGLLHANQVKADSDRVFELMIYHTIPGKELELEAIFRDVSKLQDKYEKVNGEYNVDAIYMHPTDFSALK